ncbi:hypothetical protein AAFN85_15405 [Mucilaginibacter sp. CAU 1740]|uniref:hypothetical protein n=1 Tax=Mucilaginibacter sp. CAU 1740 TaxID=3140365 RepID=UPI00325B3B9F
MNLFPYRDFSIISPLSSADAEAQLNILITPQFVNSKKIKYPDYNGTALNGKFKIEKARVGRSGLIISFAGIILPDGESCKIEVKVSPAPWSLMPVCMFLVFEFILICLTFSEEGGGIPYWVPLVVALLGYFLLIAFVKYETGVYRRIFLKVLNGTLARNGN